MTTLQRSLRWLVVSATAFAPAISVGRAIAAEPNDAAAAARAEDLLKAMTLHEKIGQMTQADLKAIKDKADIAKYALGSMLSGGDSDPDDITAAGWAKTHDELPVLGPQEPPQDPAHLRHRRGPRAQQRRRCGGVATTSAWVPCAIPNWSRRPLGSPRSRWSPRGSAGRLPRVSPSPAMNAGAALMRASERTPGLAETLGVAAVNGLQGVSLADSTSVLAFTSITWATAARLAASIRATPCATTPRSGRYICRVTSRQSRRGPRRSWPHTAVGTARRCTVIVRL